MLGPANPFPLPDSLPADLARLHSLWAGLRRAGNTIPFSDDLNPSALSQHAGRVLLIDVFDKPERFRFSLADPNLVPSQEAALSGKFLDEIDLGASFAYLRAQASATVEARAPTYFRIGSRGLSPGFARLLLPLWGDGRISMLVGVLDRY
jgi:hypothetical protein